MEQKKTNQEKGRKTRGKSKTLDDNQPSKAPRQDEDGRELIGSRRPVTNQADGYSDKQGISNRPAVQEHAFPGSEESEGPETSGPQDDQGVPRQQGGNRGGV
jgi:hypothetical protein